MIFNYPDKAPFRDALTKAGFYKEWKGKFGAEAWAKLEKYSGKLGLTSASACRLMAVADAVQPRSPDDAPPRRVRCASTARWRWLTEIPAAALVVAEIVILFAGVVSRYVFNKPLTWSDELASVLFLWLAMLGAVIALRRGEHMRLTTFVNALRAGAAGVGRHAGRADRHRVRAADPAAPAYEYGVDQWMIVDAGAGDPRRAARGRDRRRRAADDGDRDRAPDRALARWRTSGPRSR